jgi:hypothetical protein
MLLFDTKMIENPNSVLMVLNNFRKDGAKIARIRKVSLYIKHQSMRKQSFVKLLKNLGLQTCKM